MHTSILHISDLHRESQSESDQRIILNAFVEDLRRQRENGISIDLVLFTGDIVRKAECADDYVLAAQDVANIIAAADVPETLFVFCPGNHDADQRYVAEHIETLADFRKTAGNRDDFNALSQTTKFKDYVDKVFENYQAFLGLHNTSLRVFASPFGEVRLFPERSIGVASINTALLSSAGIKGHSDRNALAVPEHGLSECLSHLPASYGKIVIGHHPMDWLNDQSRVVFEEALAGIGARYFHGHMHDVNPEVYSDIGWLSDVFPI